MAKAGFWLRGAKGKLADSVLSKGENATIIREHVVPRNAQTEMQMVNRVAFATVAQAAKYMLPIIGQTFQGAANEKFNRRAFQQANINLLKRNFIRYNGIGGGPALNPDMTAANPKGVSQLIPNMYIMSQGSLSLPGWLTAKTKVNAINPERSNIYADPINGGSEHVVRVNIGDAFNPIEVLTDFYGLKLGQQITVCGICTDSSESVMAFDSDMPDFVRYSQFKALRAVIINDEDAAADASVNVTADTTVQQIKDSISALFDANKTDSDFLSCILAETEITLTPGEGYVAITLRNSIVSDDYVDIFNLLIGGDILGTVDSYDCKAACAILSEYINNQWSYSNSQMAVLPKNGSVVASNMGYYGYDYSNAYKTYLKGSGNTTSQLYTRRGGQDNTIG